MTNAMNKLNKIPSHVVKELGLSDNWQSNISPKQQKMVVKLALKFKDALKKLSKN